MATASWRAFARPTPDVNEERPQPWPAARSGALHTAQRSPGTSRMYYRRFRGVRAVSASDSERSGSRTEAEASHAIYEFRLALPEITPSRGWRINGPGARLSLCVSPLARRSFRRLPPRIRRTLSFPEREHAEPLGGAEHRRDPAQRLRRPPCHRAVARA